MKAEFSIEGDDIQKKVLVEHAIQKFGLDLDKDFAAFFSDETPPQPFADPTSAFC